MRSVNFYPVDNFALYCLPIVMQITGHEGVLIVGLTVHISCTTNLKDHVKIQWLFGNFKELETSTTQEVVLHRKLEPSDLNGPTFICRITGSDDTVYNEMITLKVKGNGMHEHHLPASYSPVICGIIIVYKY